MGNFFRAKQGPFKIPIIHGKDIIWFYITNSGPQLGEQFHSWREVKEAMIRAEILRIQDNMGVFALVCAMALEEKMHG